MPLISMLVGEFYVNEKLDFIIAPFVMPSFKAWIFILAMEILVEFIKYTLQKVTA